MKKIIILIAFSTLISCKKNTEDINSSSDGSNTEVTDKKDCNNYSAESAVISYLMKTGVIEYNGQAKCKATKINDDCDYKVTVTFYLENLYSGDGTRDYMVSFDGQEYFVH